MRKNQSGRSMPRTGRRVLCARSLYGRGLCALFAIIILCFFSSNVVAKKFKRQKREDFVRKHRLKALEQKEEIKAWAKSKGLKHRHKVGDQLFELTGFDEDGRPLMVTTLNSNAAISGAADLVREVFPYDANGIGFTLGVWDGGAVRSTHQEFEGRVQVIDSVSLSSHSTHVAGSIGAAGIDFSAMGMSPEVFIDSYDWNDDVSEMGSRGAQHPNEPGTIYISNHSYGNVAGWTNTNWSGSWGYHWWYGSPWNGASSVGYNFGQYNSSARDFDDTAYTYPYYLIVKGAGNDRSDNPSTGSTVYYSTDFGGSWNSLTYSTEDAPPGDGIYKSGYDTLVHRATAKNLLVVGSVTDAVSGGVRDVSQASLSSGSAWGPTDDGRIKPDIVTNGVGVYSTYSSSDTSYGSISGTSMASAVASGSVMLLVDYFEQLHPGDAMLSSTLKGVVLHTADDLYNPGPDYKSGWGLMNTERAAETIRLHKFREGLVNSSNPTVTYQVYCDGSEAVVATLCWTDPPASSTTSHDNSTPRLKNDLDMRIYEPNGTQYFPFVLDRLNPDNVATTGDNDLDNVEQVVIANSLAGIYTIEITYEGSLTDSEQAFSLVSEQPFVLDVSTEPLGSSVIDLPQLTPLLQDANSDFQYVIETLPDYGELIDPCDPCEPFIHTVPYCLEQGQTDVNYVSSLACWTGDDIFEFSVQQPNTPCGSLSGSAGAAVVDISIPDTNIFSTDFSGGFPPGWIYVDGGTSTDTWTHLNPGGRTNENWTGTFMIVDSDNAGNENMDEQLVSQNFDFSNYHSVFLSFKHYFNWRWFRGDEKGDVDINIDGGGWQNLLHYEGSDAEGLVELDLTSIAAGHSDVQIRWRYYDANRDYYWGIDDVLIIGSQTISPPAGDFEPDCDVDFPDYVVLANAWMSDPNDTNWNEKVDISDPADEVIDELDLEVLANNWLIVAP